VYGAVWETTGTCWTLCSPRRAKAHCIDFLCWIDDHISADTQRIYAILDNLDMHHCHDLLLFQLHHPRWEFVSQHKYAAYLNLTEPRWKVLRSLALNGRRFETWQQIVEAVEAATTYWNAHKHPFVWGRRRRHLPARRSQRYNFTFKALRI
jgi:hypothetical protein